MAQYSFSGHETFTCRQLWLKKGYDFLEGGHSFSQGDAVVELGVGKNMVGSIRHWLQAFGLINSQHEIQSIARHIFDSKANIGRDPYLEDIRSLWLLHFLLVYTNKASLYQIIFRVVSAERPRFDESFLMKRINTIVSESSKSAAVKEKTIKADFSVFRRLYVRPNGGKSSIKSIEDDLSSLLIDLGLVQRSQGEGGQATYNLEGSRRPDLPAGVLLYALWKLYPENSAVTFNELLQKDGPARIFALSKDGLMDKIQELIDSRPGIEYVADGGIQQVTFANQIGQFTEEEIINLIYG